MNTLQWIHVVAAVIVLSEALNKLERTAPFASGLSWHDRLVDGLKALAWALLALGAGCTVATPMLLACGLSTGYSPVFDLDPPLMDEVSVMVGFAVLIVRTRVKEG